MTTNTINLPRNLSLDDSRSQTSGQLRDRMDPQDRFGRNVAARLAEGASQLPYDLTERLRAARTQALAGRKREVSSRNAAAAGASGAAGRTTKGSDGTFWHRIASALPLIALAAGLVLIHTIENDRRASEVAEVDAALLTDDLPPAAYADPGFAQFLKTGVKAGAKGAADANAETAGGE